MGNWIDCTKCDESIDLLIKYFNVSYLDFIDNKDIYKTLVNKNLSI